MKRPVILIVGAASGALLLAAVGASAHMGPLSKFVGTQSVTFGDEATGARVEPADAPEPTETPEAPATTQPAPVAETEEDVDVEQEGENEGENGAAAAAADSVTKHESSHSESGDHEGSGD